MRTERILIKPAHGHYRAAKRTCRLASAVYNQALYYMRQSFFNSELLSWADVDKILKFHHTSLYAQLPAAMSQAIIKKVGTDFKSFFSKFKEKPRIPHYSRHAKTAIQPFQSLSIRDGQIRFPVKIGMQPIDVHCCDNQSILAKNATVKELRVVPHGNCYWLEVVYDEVKSIKPGTKSILLNKSQVISIDIGINNLLSIISNKPDFTPVLVNGKIIKSLNQHYNKNAAVLRAKGHYKHLNALSVKRFCQINDYFHKVSYAVIQLCLTHDIGKIVIGKNTNWKQGVNIGKVNNQKFVSVPHNSVIEKIRYKAGAYGIEVIDQEEAHTSKSDALSLDPLPKYEKGKKHTFQANVNVEDFTSLRQVA
jgi:putative transposase